MQSIVRFNEGIARIPDEVNNQSAARILAAAARLFAARGVAGTGVRDITAAAEVNLAAINYHFGSKERLVEAVLARSAQRLVEERLRGLAACAEGPDRPPMLEQLISAYVSPSLSYGREAGVDGVAFIRLRARLSVESEEVYRRLLARTFDESSRRFLEAIKAALPALPPDLVTWRFHFMMGSMIFCQVDNGRIQSISEGAIDASDPEGALARLIPFLAAGFRAPP